MIIITQIIIFKIDECINISYKFIYFALNINAFRSIRLLYVETVLQSFVQ